MLEFRGASALSDFRLERLLASLRRSLPSILRVQVHFHHFVDHSRVPAVQELRVLERLLDHDPHAPGATGGQLLLTVPRPGTISPWSSKATDIAHVCGLDFVRRIERGRLWLVESGSVLAPAEQRTLGAMLHDPMTEAVLTTIA